MRTVLQYEADDGSIWSTPEAARGRDQLISAVADAMAILPPRDDAKFSKSTHYVQHSRQMVLAARKALLEVASRAMPGWYRDKPDMFDPAHEPDCNFFGRVVSDDDRYKPISEAWWRFSCIDAAGREWQQPYFVRNPPAGATRV